MICETCHGDGYLLAAFFDPDKPDHRVWAKIPCTDCGGSGVAHCCEGDRMTEDEDQDG